MNQKYDILEIKVRLVSVSRYQYLTLKRDWYWYLISKIISLPLVCKCRYSLIIRDQHWSLFSIKFRYKRLLECLATQTIIMIGLGSVKHQTGYSDFEYVLHCRIENK